MTPDVDIRTYYLQFISDTKIDIYKYQKELEEIGIQKEELYNYIKSHKEEYHEKYHINLDKFEVEFINKRYNPSDTLYKIVLNLLKEDIIEDRTLLIQLGKYLNLLERENNNKRLIELAYKRKELTFSQYRDYVYKFFVGVHKAALEGFGYRFGHGIGHFIINYWNNEFVSNKKLLDFARTRKNKQELIKKGLRPYDEKEAIYYKERGIPYDGVEYRVYMDDAFRYEIIMTKSRICDNQYLDYERTEYINTSYRGLSFQEIADRFCKTIDDIYNLQCDIRVKLNILLYKFPDKYLNFIRNAERSKYKPRKNYS